ncbi:hypothetical protein R3P38DRAFT_2767722 [Favolaschia claudopus]|uniref:Uncharacterized protein n=1 Tax=Favolaschia claudopus TaxID=2862362 RepID=A0AAW0CSN8_9AGAR
MCKRQYANHPSGRVRYHEYLRQNRHLWEKGADEAADDAQEWAEVSDMRSVGTAGANGKKKRVEEGERMAGECRLITSQSQGGSERKKSPGRGRWDNRGDCRKNLKSRAKGTAGANGKKKRVEEARKITSQSQGGSERKEPGSRKGRRERTERKSGSRRVREWPGSAGCKRDPWGGAVVGKARKITSQSQGGSERKEPGSRKVGQSRGLPQESKITRQSDGGSERKEKAGLGGATRGGGAVVGKARRITSQSQGGSERKEKKRVDECGRLAGDCRVQVRSGGRARWSGKRPKSRANTLSQTDERECKYIIIKLAFGDKGFLPAPSSDESPHKILKDNFRRFFWSGSKGKYIQSTKARIKLRTRGVVMGSHVNASTRENKNNKSSLQGLGQGDSLVPADVHVAEDTICFLPTAYCPAGMIVGVSRSRTGDGHADRRAWIESERLDSTPTWVLVESPGRIEGRLRRRSLGSIAARLRTRISQSIGVDGGASARSRQKGSADGEEEGSKRSDPR